MKRSSLLFATLGLLALEGCSKKREAAVAPHDLPSEDSVFVEDTPKDLCVVLSVGAEQGLSHIGVLLALRERAVPVSCVVGTSMGGLVGGLFAHSPESDLAGAYRALFRRYEKKTRSDAGPLGVGLLFGVGRRDWVRMRGVLREALGNRRIEGLSIPFLSEHQVAEGTGLRREVVRGGVLADEIAAGIANPFLFSDIAPAEGTKLDPGADRVSAVPLDVACREFPDHQFLVSNVTGEPAYIQKDLECDYQEIDVPRTDVDAARAIQGQEGELRRLVFAGFSAAERDVHWTALPQKVQEVTESGDLVFGRLVVSVTVSKENAEGEPWDALGGAPDPFLSFRVVPCAGCDSYGTSAGVERTSKREDKFTWSEDFGVVAVRPGFEIDFDLRDSDLAEDDSVGRGRVALKLSETRVVRTELYELHWELQRP